MTIIVGRNSKGELLYSSLGGIESTKNALEKAKQLDATIKKKIEELTKALQKKESLKGDVESYWNLGNIMRDIFFKSGLVEKAERFLFYKNIQLHAPPTLLAKDRGPNRIHLDYCFRLAGFSKDKALRMKWGEWVFLFDSPGINNEPRFDRWFDSKMSEKPSVLDRENLRLFARCLNNLFGRIEMSELNDVQVDQSYETAWMLKKQIINIPEEKRTEAMDRVLIHEKKQINGWLAEVVEGQKSANDFANLVSRMIAAGVKK